jgi:thiol-disulfide isomerase/thioredoxin
VTSGPPAAALDAAELRSLGGDPHARATLLQFSTAFCAPCRATRSVLRHVAGLLDGVAHLEVDAEAHLGLVRRLDVRATPTTLLLDATGVERGRRAGIPRAAAVVAAVAPLLDPGADGAAGAR